MMPVYDIQTPLDLLNGGNSSEAIPHLEFLVQHMPSHVTAHVLLAQAYSNEERWNDALSAWQNALFLMPNSPAIRKGLRQVLRILSRQPVLHEPALSEAPPVAPMTDRMSSEGDSLFVDNLPQVEEPVAEVDMMKTEAEPVVEDPPSVAEPPPLPVDSPAISTAPAKPIAMPFVPPVVAAIVENGAGITADDELDHLIQELESARIVPNPDHDISEPTVEEADIADVASETLARIYEGQKKFEEAAGVYDKLAELHPEKADSFEAKALELRARMANEGD